VLSRSIGAVYRFILPRIIGTEGLGLFGMAYPMYGMLLNLSTIGVNIAISKFMAEHLGRGDEAGALRVFRAALALMAGVGLALSVALALAAAPAARLLHTPGAFWPILATAPAVFLVAILGAYRGYFQGLQYMTPTANSQVFEQLVRVLSIFAFAWLLLPLGIPFAAAGATSGATTGALAALVILAWFVRRPDMRLDPARRPAGAIPEPYLAIAGKIVRFAIPISVAGVAVSVMQLADYVVPARLAATGLDATAISVEFARLTQMALTLINLPTVITYAIQLSLVPAVAAAAARGEMALVRHRAATGVRLTVTLALPAVVGLYLLAAPLTGLLFGDPGGGPALAAMSAGVLFLTLQQTTSGVLQGLGRTDLPARNLAAGALVKLAITWALTGPALGIRGAAYGTVAGFLVASSLNLTAVRRLSGAGLDIRGAVARPAVATAAMGLVVPPVFSAVGGALGRPSLATLLAVATGVVVYGGVLLAVGGITARDLEMIPRVGPRLAGWGRRLRLLREGGEGNGT